MTLGIPVVKPCLSRLMLIWKNAFPRSTKELESETERGDLFTWQVLQLLLTTITLLYSGENVVQKLDSNSYFNTVYHLNSVAFAATV